MNKQPPSSCPCHSGLPYASCCAPYHNGTPAPTPLALMRSRYSAYAMHNVDYILKTGPQTSSKGVAQFCAQTTFIGLEILETTENTVTFRAILQQQGKDASFTEKSLFAPEGEGWVYKERLK